MAKGKAESLDEVLEIARTRRQSGMLSVEHTQGGRVEEGELYLQAGQPIYARVGQLVGQDALNWLLKWRNVYFSINAEDLKLPAGVSESVSSNSSGLSAVPASTAQSPLPKRSPNESNSSIGQASERDRDNTSDQVRASSYTPGIEWLVPQKRNIERDVLSLPLTRRLRFIYFLIDGRRTISDLSRCTGKNIQEVELILRELQEQGLVIV
jgi:hypothetical protein